MADKYRIIEQWRYANYDGQIITADDMQQAASESMRDPDKVLAVCTGHDRTFKVVADCYSDEDAQLVAGALNNAGR